jgi:hypothetical protein
MALPARDAPIRELLATPLLQKKTPVMFGPSFRRPKTKGEKVRLSLNHPPVVIII